MSRFIIFLLLLASCFNTEAQISEQIYVKDVSNEYSSRERIKGVKKRAYRKNEAKRRRILRHKK